MTVVLDHTQDLSGKETHRLTSLYAPPEFVKEASHDRLHGNPETLPAHAYGDATERVYPCHSAPATWMSALFFFDKKAELNPVRAEAVEERIMKSAQYFNILPQIEELKTKVSHDARHDMNRLPDSDFALVWVDEDGHKERNYPIRNPNEVKMAADWFGRYRDEFTFPDRQRIAGKIMEKASQHMVPLDNAEDISKSAGFGYCSAQDIKLMLEKRANLVARSHPDYAQEVRSLAALVEQRGSDVRDHDYRCKLAATMDMFDRQTGLARMYDEGGLERPEEVLFQVTEKAASNFIDEHLSMTSGTIYEKQALEAMDAEHIRKWMGSEFADEVTVGGLMPDVEKMAIIAATLPRNDAEMFDRMAAEAGVPIYARDKAAQAQGLSTEELIGLAQQYGTEPGLNSSILE